MRQQILLVEDEADWQDEVAELLTISGYDVVKASSVKEACSLIDTISQGLIIDLMILDLGLSEKTGIDSGLTVLAYLRERYSYIPCIVFTAREVSMSRADSLFRKYLVAKGLEKPRDLPYLVEVVRQELTNPVAKEKSDTRTDLIRQILTTAFNDEELTTLCFDHFRAVYEQFGTGMGKGQKIQQLLEYCDRHDQLKKLLQLIETHNPAQYARLTGRATDNPDNHN